MAPDHVIVVHGLRKAMDPLRAALARLDARRREHQTRLAASPLFAALASGSLPLACYVGWLRATAIVLSVLEDEVAPASHATLAAVWDERMRRLPLLRGDLESLERRVPPDPAGPSLLAIVLAERLRPEAARHPAAFLFCLSALARSFPESAEIRARLSHCFRLNESAGLAYLTSLDAWTNELEGRLSRFQEQAAATAADYERALEAASDVFAWSEKILRALYPVEWRQGQELLILLNPAAGGHPLPLDLREFQAAVRAGEASWRRFPYYASRYGERGRGFTCTDSAWLVTLTREPLEVLHEQIDWLGIVLASRGMPRWLLDLHLETLHQELVQAVPAEAARYAKLLQAAEKLRATRQAHVSEDRFRRLARAFDVRVGAKASNRLPGTGELLVAAVADEKAGLVHAVSSLASWLSEPSRFSAEWIEAVQATIRAARNPEG